jgi:hypothetical protein
VDHPDRDGLIAMKSWERAILKTHDLLGGCAANKEIYANVGKFIVLTTEHLSPTIHGGRPAFVHRAGAILRIWSKTAI